jgi:hypothetical protein
MSFMASPSLPGSHKRPSVNRVGDTILFQKPNEILWRLGEGKQVAHIRPVHWRLDNWRIDPKFTGLFRWKQSALILIPEFRNLASVAGID